MIMPLKENLVEDIKKYSKRNDKIGYVVNL